MATLYLWSLQKKDDRFSFPRCSLGKNRWQWVVFKGLLCDEEPIASGIAVSAGAAEKEAEKAVGPVRATGGWAAQAYRRKRLAIERSQKFSNGQGASPVEYVYRCYRYYSDYDGEGHDVIEKHRIVKRTKKRIFVDKDEFQPGVELNGDWRDYVQSTLVLDRHEFEAHGMATWRSRGWWNDGRFYSDPAIYVAERALAVRPESFVVLGVPADASSAQSPPPTGDWRRRRTRMSAGMREDFKRVHRAFEEAMAIVGSKDPAIQARWHEEREV